MEIKVLIACEFSGTVREAFNALAGFHATSCDLLPPTDGRIDFHYQGDVRDILHQGWDLMIAHPPCTFLCNSGVRWLKTQPDRWGKMVEAAGLFKELLNAPIGHIAIENPVMHGYAVEQVGRKHDQTIQPWQHGEDASKRTCFWLKNLPLLQPTEIAQPSRLVCCGLDLSEGVGKYGCPNCNGDKVARRVFANQTPTGQNNLGPSDERWRLRSATYPGIARAIADQWGQYVLQAKQSEAHAL